MIPNAEDRWYSWTVDIKTESIVRASAADVAWLAKQMMDQPGRVEQVEDVLRRVRRVRGDGAVPAGLVALARDELGKYRQLMERES